MKKLYRNILLSGVHESQEYQERRGIILTNNISLLLCYLILMVYLVNFVPLWSIPKIISWQDLLEAWSVFLLPVFLNRFSLTTLSRIFLILGSMGLVCHLHIAQMMRISVVETSSYDSLLIFLLASSPLPFLLFEKKKWPVTAMFVVLMILCFWYFDNILGALHVSHSEKGIAGMDYPLMKLRVFISYIIIGGGSLVFQLIIYKNDRLNSDMLTQLKVRTDEIEGYNEELKNSQEKLNEINQNLEELVAKKTMNLVMQNKKLIEYAHINAHLVRGPLARILGLLLVASMEKDVDYGMFLNKIECEIAEIEGVFKSISKDLNDSKYMISKGFA